MINDEWFKQLNELLETLKMQICQYQQIIKCTFEN
jgi:hypothetical protein